VIPVVVGSSPISHPNLFLVSSCEILFIILIIVNKYARQRPGKI
jgi:hypothetical protein